MSAIFAEPPEFEEKMNEKRYSDAIRLAQAEADSAKETGDVPGQGVALALAAKALLASGANNEAIDVSQQAAEIFKQFGDKEKQGGAMYILGKACLAEGYALDAQDVAERAMYLFRQAKQQSGMADAMITMASALTLLGDFGNAAYRAEGAAELFKSMKNLPFAGLAMAKAAEAYLEKKEKDPEASASATREAMRTASAAVKLYPEPEGEGYADATRLLAAAYLAKGELDEALVRANEAEAIFEKLDLSASQGASLLVAAKVHYEKDDVVEAVSAARKAQGLLEVGGADAEARKAADLILKFQRSPDELAVLSSTTKEAETVDTMGGGESRLDIRKLVPGIEKATIYAEYEGYEGRSATTGGRPRAKSERALEKLAEAQVQRDAALFSVRWVPQPHLSGSDAKMKDDTFAANNVLNFPIKAGTTAPHDAIPVSTARPLRGTKRGEIPFKTGDRIWGATAKA